MNCVYCGRDATTKDHVPPRCLLEKPYPKDLITLWCCQECNNGFSLDEQYFLTVLGQIGTSPTLVNKVEEGGQIDRALTHSPALDERIIQSLETSEDGQITLRPETQRIHRVIRKIALGLFVHRYAKVPSWDAITPVAAYPYNIEDQRPAPFFVATFTERFRSKTWTHVQRGIFSYIVVRDPAQYSKYWCIIDFHQTLWGVSQFPNPRSIPSCQKQQLWLFDENGI